MAFGTFILSVCLLFFQAFSADAFFEYTDCARGSKMQVSHLDIVPNPILLPGDISVSLTGVNLASIASAYMRMTMTRKTLGVINLPVPCVENVGSCDYENICTILNQMVREDWMGVMGVMASQIINMFASVGVDATRCPFQPGSVDIKNYNIQLPPVAPTLAWFAEGDYHIHLSFIENSTLSTILCLDAELHLKQDDSLCSGISCIFGRK